MTNEDTSDMTLNGIEYVRKDSIKASMPAKTLKGKPYVIVRTYSAGVFAGYLDSRKDKEAVILHARRIWSWEGAASLSQLAQEGTSKPDKCKFPCEVDKVTLTEAIEILDVTEDARASIQGVPQWKE